MHDSEIWHLHLALWAMFHCNSSVFHLCQICRSPYAAWSISEIHGRASHGDRQGSGRCYHSKTLNVARTICKNALENVKMHPMFGHFFNSPVICKSLRSYGNNFICDYIMAHTNVVLYSLYELTLISLRHFNSITLTQTTPLKSERIV